MTRVLKQGALCAGSLLLPALLLLSAGCATTRNYSASGRAVSTVVRSTHTVETTLVFLLTGDRGAALSETQWQAFLDDYITPRFENRVLVRDGHTQYWPREGDFIRSAVKEVVLYHNDTRAADAAIGFIRMSYRRRFDKPPVLKTSRFVTLSYEEAPIEAPVINVIGEITSDRVNESSGLACSHREDGLLWTHNDSGDIPRFFAMNRKGEILREFRVEGAEAVDWEDMCSFRMDDKHFLLFADVGDNHFRRDQYTLYLVEEPLVMPDGPPVESVPVFQVLDFTYEDGPRNCEAVAVDAATRTVYLISKDWGWTCHAYALPLREGGALIARRVAELGFPLVTAMDIHRDGSNMVALTYGDAYVFNRGVGDWADVLAQDPLPVPMPKRRQGEAVCFGADPRTLYLTSEKLPSPVWEVIIPSVPDRTEQVDGPSAPSSGF
ncbi:MAG: DUF3574 domain-containing protein [Spartobacteria bacterium]|nr:DUF3574 domain-containing protein [Spartobacteria bacterium]